MKRWLPWLGAAVALQAVAVGVYFAAAPSPGAEGDRGFHAIAPQTWSQLDGELVGQAGRVAPQPGRPALLHFWATWCAPCRDELPRVLELVSNVPEVDVWCVATDAQWDAVLGYFHGQVPASVVHDVDGKLAQRLGVSELPDSYLVDQFGRVHARALGTRRWDATALRAALTTEGRL